MNKRELLITYFKSYGVHSQEMVADLYSQSKELALQKGDIINWETRHCVYFNLSGYQRLHVQVGDKERNLLFIEPAGLVVLENKLIPEIDTEVALSSIAKSRLLRIPKKTYQYLLDTYKDFEQLINLHRRQMIQKLMARCITLSYLPMDERFKKFVKKKLYLLQHIPHKHLASYLNIHPTNFSTLLSKTKIS